MSADAPAGVARVGPNAVTQLAAALDAAAPGAAGAIFAAAGLASYRAAPPSAMIPQTEAAALHHALFRARPEDAEAIAFDAGLRTGDYLLAHRIPKPAQALLRALPARLGARLLLAAIARHAWTFAGSGVFAVEPGREIAFAITANPLATNPCAWHRGVFTRLFRALISRGAEVMETACVGAGAPACRFVLRL